MGTPKSPTPLDRFLPVDYRTLQHVADNGQLTIKFATDSQACNTKYRLIRLIRSLEAFKPNDPLTKATKTFVFKWRKDTDVLTIVDRARSQEVDAQEAALRGEVDVVSSDPMEIRPIDYPKE